MAFGAALALAAACGGQAFTTIESDAGGGGDAASDATGDGSGMVSTDAPADVTASDTASADGGSHDAAPIPDAAGDSTGDAVATSDGATDAGPSDAFVLDVLEEPPPHCTGQFACVPSVPSGWAGPFEVYASSGASPPCSANFAGPAYDGNNNLAAKPAVCGCGCGNATGITCSTPPISFYGQVVTGNTCTSSNYCAALNLQPGVCTYVPPQCSAVLMTSQDMSAGASVPTITNASCPPMPSVAVTPVAWGINARACVSSLPAAAVDCTAGSVCAPVAASPFGSQLCISQPGNVACPATGYTAGQVFYGSVSDGRACTRCSCGNVSGASCSATVGVSSSTNATCSSNTISYIAPFSCDAVQQGADFRLTVTTSGGCTASTVSSTGTVTPATPTTFCCLP